MGGEMPQGAQGLGILRESHRLQPLFILPHLIARKRVSTPIPSYKHLFLLVRERLKSHGCIFNLFQKNFPVLSRAMSIYPWIASPAVRKDGDPGGA